MSVKQITKPDILFLADITPEIKKETLGEFFTNITMEEKREYAALLKASGKQNKEIAQLLGVSRQWVTKYANPLLPDATERVKYLSSTHKEDTKEPDFAGLPIHTVLEFSITELKKEQRQFAGWGSVEIKDSQDEVVSIKGLETIMPTYIKRGAPIMFGHSNRHVGRVLKYQIKDKDVKGKLVPGLWLEGEIFNHYRIDDQAWDALQFAHKVGLPVLSLGATPIGHPVRECNEKECFKKYNELQLYEFTITEQQKGSVGANPEATVEMAMAKSEAVETSPIAESAWIGGKLLKLKQKGALPEDDREVVDLMLSSCQTCQEEYKALLKQGLSEDQAKGTLFTELVKAMSQTEEETKAENFTGDVPPPADTSKDGPDLAAALAEMGSMMKQILAAVTKNDDPREDARRDQDEAPPMPPPTEEEEKADTPNEETVPKVPALTLAKQQVAQLSDEEFQKIAMEKGFKRVSMPASPPSVSQERDITKGSPKNTPKRLTIEEMREAYHSGEGVTGVEARFKAED